MEWSINSYITDAHSCNCIGPQNSQPKCPCDMRNVIERNGRYIQREVDLGPVTPMAAMLQTDKQHRVTREMALKDLEDMVGFYDNGVTK